MLDYNVITIVAIAAVVAFLNYREIKHGKKYNNHHARRHLMRHMTRHFKI